MSRPIIAATLAAALLMLSGCARHPTPQELRARRITTACKLTHNPQTCVQARLARLDAALSD